MPNPNECPLEILLKQLSGQWTLYILWVLDTNGPLRFGELRRQVDGISTKVLTERLRMLESIQIVHREHKPTIPPQVTYSMTGRGQELSEALHHLYELSLRWYGNSNPGIEVAVGEAK
ncbi:MAG: helix-turn-helix transcriptional regulator [Spirulina sp. SIO3F2]|nr:helix-turn-helix transcriptional regulator [Spirulina sp. SIO3F2]